MNTDPRLPTEEQLENARKLLAVRKNWLIKEFIPRLQKQLPGLEQYYIKSSVFALTEEDLQYFEEGEEIDNTPLTDFEITLGKIIELPDPEVDDESTRQCREHRFAGGIEWTEELIEKIKEINSRTSELLTDLFEKSIMLRDILNEEYEKGNNLFADFEINGKIVYTNHALKLYPENENSGLAHVLCEMTNHHIYNYETLQASDGRGDKNLEDVLFLGKDLKNWNIEIFRAVPEEIPINYYMHCVFCDGYTYNLGDILNMKGEDFQAQITISTCDNLLGREEKCN